MIYFIYAIFFILALVTVFSLSIFTLGVVGVPVFFGVMISTGLIADLALSSDLKL